MPGGDECSHERQSWGGRDFPLCPEERPIFGDAMNQARASTELQEVRQRKYIQHTS
jgi:hypothetical protein